MMTLKKGGEKIAEGDLTYKVETKNLLPEFKKHAESLNSISAGMQSAVTEQMKSERMKTELITNVSHDLKTPLTSIVNYVDLLKKQPVTPPEAVEYIAVLDRQAARLKRLTEDLVEASKASTGNLQVSLERMDLGVLLSQTAGEFQEKLADKGLKLVIRGQEKAGCVTADGRHLWRVLENLMNNVCKYALEGTRVYMDVTPGTEMTAVCIKNVSRSELTVSPEELTERFVRGDASRSTEGSGLGLSIAMSLTELQGGKLTIGLDGDLFKATVALPRAE
jgi:signal transduction histidine kinase